jgi:hypothetical protein
MSVDFPAQHGIDTPQFRFMSTSEDVRTTRVQCSRVSALPSEPSYKHHGADVQSREDMISHEFQHQIAMSWQLRSSAMEEESIISHCDYTILDAIPKKYPWPLQCNIGQQGWDLQIRLRFCYTQFWKCVLFWSIASGAFIGFWLWLRPGDLQGAFAPPGILSVLLMAYAAHLRKIRG